MLTRMWRWIGLAAVVLATAGCAVNPVTGRSELMFLSEDEELAMGREAYPSLRWQDGGPLQVDEATRAYLDGIVRNLNAVSHRSNLPVDFTLHSASIPNAWAIPGYTAMHRGLLQDLENEAQFAFVMGHEMGHVAARHSAQRQTYALVSAGLLGLASIAVATQKDSDTRLIGQAALGAGFVGAQLLLLKYDRSQELEADRLGVLYMARAGYDPREAIRAHQMLERSVNRYLDNIGKTREDPGPLADLLSTHPRHEVRISEIEEFIRALPPGDVRRTGDGHFAERWMTRTVSIRSLAPAYAHFDRARVAYADKKRDLVRQELAAAMQLADQAQFSAFQGVALAQEKRWPEAEQAFERAVQIFPDYQPALHGLGAAEIGQGRFAAAIPPLEASLRLRPGYQPSQQLLSLARSRLGRRSEAFPPWRVVAWADLPSSALRAPDGPRARPSRAG